MFLLHLKIGGMEEFPNIDILEFLESESWWKLFKNVIAAAQEHLLITSFFSACNACEQTCDPSGGGRKRTASGFFRVSGQTWRRVMYHLTPKKPQIPLKN